MEVYLPTKSLVREFKEACIPIGWNDIVGVGNNSCCPVHNYHVEVGSIESSSEEVNPVGVIKYLLFEALRVLIIILSRKVSCILNQIKNQKIRQTKISHVHS